MTAQRQKTYSSDLRRRVWFALSLEPSITIAVLDDLDIRKQETEEGYQFADKLIGRSLSCAQQANLP
jgi:hypothetical protein